VSRSHPSVTRPKSSCSCTHWIVAESRATLAADSLSTPSGITLLSSARSAISHPPGQGRRCRCRPNKPRLENVLGSAFYVGLCCSAGLQTHANIAETAAFPVSQTTSSAVNAKPGETKTPEPTSTRSAEIWRMTSRVSAEIGSSFFKKLVRLRPRLQGLVLAETNIRRWSSASSWAN
jgi:hypothetical protein